MPIVGGPSLAQNSYRGRNDDGSETTATWIAAANTDFSSGVIVDTKFRVRFLIKLTGTVLSNITVNLKVKYSLNAGAYTDVAAQGATTDAVRYADSSNITDNEATTEQMAGSGTFVTGAVDEDGSTGTITFTAANQDTEVEFVLEVYSGMVANGDTINLRVYRTNNNALDTYTQTPTITVSDGYEIDADAGSYTVSGQAAGLYVGRKVAADAGSYALSGQEAALKIGRKVTADAGAYTLSGQTANLLVGRKVAADAGTYLLDGQAAGLLATRKITADQGAYNLTGYDVTFAITILLVAETGTYNLTGQDASLVASLILTAEPGSYLLVGNDADLVYVPIEQAGTFPFIANMGTMMNRS